MSKNLVFQYHLPANGVGKLPHYENEEGIPDWAIRSNEYFQRYAETHGADYLLGTERTVDCDSNYFEICRVFLDPAFDQYDQVLYVDLDVMPKNMDANIFALEGNYHIRGWSEKKLPWMTGNPKWPISEPLVQRFNKFGAPIIRTKEGHLRMVNTGVLVWSLEARIRARALFEHPQRWFSYNNTLLDDRLNPQAVGHSSHCLDQPYLNAMFNRSKFKVDLLHHRWNRFPAVDENHECNFAHYVGKGGKKVILDIFPELDDEQSK